MTQFIDSAIADARKRVAAACGRAGRDPSSVTIVAVSKGRQSGDIVQARDAGILDIGESRVQEALRKHKELSCPGLRWHLIGHLQTNKARDAVRIFDLIHSVDSPRLAFEIDRQAGRIGKVQDILVEVNVSGEKSKYGVPPEALNALIEAVKPLRHVNLRGLMTIAPAAGDAESLRKCFRELRGLRDSAVPGACLRELSMGMTDDFEVAVEEGATMVRLGRVIFR